MSLTYRIELLDDAAEKFSDHTALMSTDLSYSFNDIQEITYKIAKTLENLNLPKQSCIGICINNRIDIPLSIMGIIAANHIAVILNPQLPSNQLIEQIHSLNIQHIIRDEGNHFLIGKSGHYEISFDSLIADSPVVTDQLDLSPKCPATIIFTSGSSAQPKAVVHSFDNFKYSAEGSNSVMPFNVGDKWLACLPFYHVSGIALIWRALCGGGTLVIESENKTIMEDIQDHNITHISLVPSQLFSLLENESNKPVLQNMKAILVGGSALSIALWQKAKAWKLPVYTTYGQSEMSASITLSDKALTEERDYHSGKLLPHRQLMINENGEILVSGETLFLGYAKIDTSTNKTTIHPTEKWFHTGDMGHLDKENNLHIMGRQDNMFISGGENIYPEEIEEAILQINTITRAVVVPIEDMKFGFRPIVFIETSNFENIKTQLPELLLQFLPKYKIPISIYNWPHEYNDISNKINRTFFKKFSIIANTSTMYTYSTTIRLHDTDAAAVIYFASLFRIMHDSFEDFLDQSGLPIQSIISGKQFAMPIVHAEANYLAPIKLGDQIDIQLSLKNRGQHSFTIQYTMLNDSGKRVATGSTTHVTINVIKGNKIALPDEILKVIER
jgi:O-succinylbenzoic acid--CoA ligase